MVHNEHVGRIFRLVFQIHPRDWMVVAAEPAPGKKEGRVKLSILPLYEPQRNGPLHLEIEVAGHRYSVDCGNCYELTPYQLIQEVLPSFFGRCSESVLSLVQRRFEERYSLMGALDDDENYRYCAFQRRAYEVFRYFDGKIGRTRR